ncbi:MAG: hypothetical protein KDC54_04810 [Lewinella sp.]|nr:hypothetical protein [Lewinella sp.]
MGPAPHIDLQGGPGAASWQRVGDLYWRGYAWQGAILLEPTEIAAQLQALGSPADLEAWLPSLNGCFALLYDSPKWGFAAVDIGRTIPLFWQVDGHQLHWTDHLQADPSSPWLTIDWPARCEFLPGHETYRPGWQQLRAGEYLSWPTGPAQAQRYFTHERPAASQDEADALREEFLSLLQQLTRRLVHWADGRTIAIPLSGGYDSRLILAALIQTGYPHLQAFTYGQAGSWEVELARRITEQLGVDWRLVPYTTERLSTYWDADWAPYADYAAKAVSLPQEQDWFALGALRQDEWLAAGSIICPGYTADFQAGSYLPPPYFRRPGTWNAQALTDHLLYRFVRRPDQPTAEAFGEFGPKNFPAVEHALISQLEDWVLSEYVSKYILNGVRAYEWWDLQWYLPLWDLAFIRFWQKVPNELRRNMALYRSTLEEHFFRPLQIYFPAYDQAPPPNRWVDWLSLREKAWLRQWRRRRPVRDVNGLHQLIPRIQEELGWPAPDPTRPVNEMIGWWCTNRWKKTSLDT